MKTIITQFGKTFLIVLLVLFSNQPVVAVFTPGAGGTLPAFTPFTTPTGKVGGLVVRSTERENNAFFTGTRAVIELRFPVPTEFGASSYTLQYSENDGVLWQNYKHNDVDLTTTGDNFSLNFAGNYKLRLLVNGGHKAGYTSNEVFAPLSSIDSRFSGWSLDESMFITGIMAPNIGRGLQAGFTVKKLSDGSDVVGALAYQWYRLNPASFEMTLIPSATNLTYITTEADAGYLTLIKATGDGVNAGGFVQIYSSMANVISNKATVSNVSNGGFTLNLYKSLTGGLTVADLKLVDKDAAPITINSVTAGANLAIYNVGATLDIAKSPFYLINNSSFWLMMTEMEGGFMTMPGVTIDITTGMNDLNDNYLSVYPIPVKDVLHFKTDATVSEATLYNTNGEVMKRVLIHKNEGTINTTKFGSGIYFLHLTSQKGVSTKKIQISK
jgi:hypothetical protein